MIAALKYWGKVTLVVLPWAAFSAALEVNGNCPHLSHLAAIVVTLAFGLPSVAVLVGNIPEVLQADPQLMPQPPVIDPRERICFGTTDQLPKETAPCPKCGEPSRICAAGPGLCLSCILGIEDEAKAPAPRAEEPRGTGKP